MRLACQRAAVGVDGGFANLNPASDIAGATTATPAGNEPGNSFPHGAAPFVPPTHGKPGKMKIVNAIL